MWQQSEPLPAYFTPSKHNKFLYIDCARGLMSEVGHWRISAAKLRDARSAASIAYRRSELRRSSFSALSAGGLSAQM